MDDPNFDEILPPRDLTSVQYVLFDAVGTLIFPDPSPAEVYHAAGQRHGLSFSLDEISRRFAAAFTKHHVGGPTAEPIERQRWRNVIADVFDTPLESGLFDELWHHFSQPESWRIFSDVAEVFKELQERGIPFGIASNFDDRLVTLCRGLPPLDRVNPVFYSSNVGWSKPRKEFFQHVQQKIQVYPLNILLVGDDEEKDLAGALNAGWQALLVDRKMAQPSHRRIASLRDLYKLLQPVSRRG